MNNTATIPSIPAAQPLRVSVFRPLILATAAATFYGIWAFIANGGSDAGLSAGMTQAILSFCAANVLALVLEWLFRVAGSANRGFALAAIGTSLISAFVIGVGHHIAGTPHVALTIAPSVVVGTVVYTLYAWRLRAASRPRRAL